MQQQEFYGPDGEALINLLLALPFLCRGWLLAGFIFIPGALLQGRDWLISFISAAGRTDGRLVSGERACTLTLAHGNKTGIDTEDEWQGVHIPHSIYRRTM